MLSARIALLCIFSFLAPALPVQASIFGEENVPLMKLVLGQILELEKLASALEVAKDQRALLEQVNAGVTRTIQQIEAIEEILRRAQGLDPKNIRRISQISDAINEVKDLKQRTQDILSARILIADHSVAQSGLQAETAYTMGQEMVRVGSDLSRESANASPGRASQISASAQSAQTLSSGVALQTLAHLVQLQAVSLDLQKAQIQARLTESQTESEFFQSQLVSKEKVR